MPAIGYKKHLVPLVQSGLKPHTIRALRKRPFRMNDDLMHYYGMRTKHCRKIRPDTICLAVTEITIDSVRLTVVLKNASVYYPQGELSATWLNQLAIRDGFPCTDAFFLFFRQTRGRKFTGQLIEWRT